MRFLALALALSLLAGCGGDVPAPPTDAESPPPLPPNGTRERPFIGLGTITAIREGIVQIDHMTVPGFMVALTTDFPLDDPGLATGLSVGQSVLFHVVQSRSDYRIVHIEPAE